ncbi:acyltransferase, partial [Paenibacillus sp. TAF58]
MKLLRKVMATLIAESRGRGIYYAVIMNLSHVVGILRAYMNKLIYYKNIESSIFSLQANSRIEAFSKHAKIHIGKFVFIRKNASIRV